jgi:hypothetical protein
MGGQNSGRGWLSEIGGVPVIALSLVDVRFTRVGLRLGMMIDDRILLAMSLALLECSALDSWK